jgi:hypothetical protein
MDRKDQRRSCHHSCDTCGKAYLVVNYGTCGEITKSGAGRRRDQFFHRGHRRKAPRFLLLSSVPAMNYAEILLSFSRALESERLFDHDPFEVRPLRSDLLHIWMYAVPLKQEQRIALARTLRNLADDIERDN